MNRHRDTFYDPTHQNHQVYQLAPAAWTVRSSDLLLVVELHS